MELDRDGKQQPESSDSLLREHKLHCGAAKKESSLAARVVVEKRNECEYKQSNESMTKCEVRIVVLNIIFNYTLLHMHDVLIVDQSNRS